MHSNGVRYDGEKKHYSIIVCTRFLCCHIVRSQKYVDDNIRKTCTKPDVGIELGKAHL